MSTIGDAHPLLWSTTPLEEVEKFKSSRKSQIRNIIIVSIICFAVGLSLIIAGTVLDGGFSIGIFLPGIYAFMAGVMGGLVAAIFAFTFYRREEPFLQSISRGEYISKWHVSEDEWRTYATEEYGATGRSRTSIWKLMAGFGFVIGTFAIVATVIPAVALPQEHLTEIFHMNGIVALVMIVLACAGFLLTLVVGICYGIQEYRLWSVQSNGPYETILASGGILFGDSVVLWCDTKEKNRNWPRGSALVARLNGCTLLTGTGNDNLVPILNISTQMSTKHGAKTFPYRIPFSYNQTQEMQRVSTILNNIGFLEPTPGMPQGLVSHV